MTLEYIYLHFTATFGLVLELDTIVVNGGMGGRHAAQHHGRGPDTNPNASANGNDRGIHDDNDRFSVNIHGDTSVGPPTQTLY